MSTDTTLLGKGLIRLGVLVMLFIVSPIILTMGFKAIDKFTEAPKSYIGYVLITIGFALTFYTIFFAFKTFKIISNSIFNNN